MKVVIETLVIKCRGVISGRGGVFRVRLISITMVRRMIHIPEITKTTGGRAVGSGARSRSS
jgi:hypothetical protein